MADSLHFDRSEESERLIELVEELTDRVQRGDGDVEEFLRARPEYEERLRRMAPMLEGLAGLSDVAGAASSISGRRIRFDAGQSMPLAETLGDFRLIRQVGAGGMGLVYEAEQLSLRRPVALKILPFASTLDPRHLTRFQNEATAAAQLKHPHIVQVLGFGSEQGVCFYAMDFIDGCSLQQAIWGLRQGGEEIPDTTRQISTPTPYGDTASAPNQPAEAAGPSESTRTVVARLFGPAPARGAAYFKAVAKIGRDVASALEHAHETGVLHRDIKPGNLMLDAAGHVWVTDFGLARIETDQTLTRTGDVLGTLRYMSPEQASGNPRLVDHRTDVYSLGATLYELATLRPMFDVMDRSELMRRLTAEDPPAPRKVNPAIPADLEVVLLKALSKSRADRYETAQALADDLERYLDCRPIAARRPTMLQRLVKWSRRHTQWLMAAVASLLALLLVMILAVAVVVSEKAKTEAARRNATDALGEARRQQAAAQRLSVSLAMDRGLALCEQGRVAEGMLWLARALETVPNDESDANRVLRANFAYWRERMVVLERIIQIAPPARFRNVAVNRQGTAAAVVTDDQVLIKSLATGDLLGPPIDTPETPTSVAFFPSGDAVLIGTTDGAVRKYEARTGRLLASLVSGEDSPIIFLAVAPDGKRAAVKGFRNRGRLFNLETCEPIEKPIVMADLPSGGVFANAETLVTLNMSSLHLWNAATGESTSPPLNTSDSAVYAVAASDDGGTLLCGHATAAVAWDLSKRRPRGAAMQHRSIVSSVAIDPQGRFFLTGTAGKIARLWDAASRRPVGQPLEHPGQIVAVSFCEQPGRFVTIGAQGEARIWRAPADHPAQLARFPILDPGRHVLLDEKGDRVAVVAAPGRLRMWRLDSGREVVGQTLLKGESLDSVTLLRGNIYSCCNGKTVIVRKPPDTAPMKAVPLPVTAPLTTGTIAQDGTILMAAGDSLIRFNPDTLQMEATWRRPAAVKTMTANFNGRRLVEYSGGELRLWSLSSQPKRLAALPFPQGVAQCAFHPTGGIVFSSGDGHVYFWAPGEEDGARELLRSHRSPRSVRLGPLGRVALSVGGDGVARLYDLATGRAIGAPFDHHSPMSMTAFSLDGRRIATVASDGKTIVVRRVPHPVEGDAQQLRQWVEKASGMKLDEDDAPRLLSPSRQ